MAARQDVYGFISTFRSQGGRFLNDLIGYITLLVAGVWESVGTL